MKMMQNMKQNRLESLKEELNLKSKDVAKLLKVNESTYSEWENSKIPIPTRRIIELADFYKINIDYIIKLSNTRMNINNKTIIDLKKIGEKLITFELLINIAIISNHSIDWILGRTNKDTLGEVYEI